MVDKKEKLQSAETIAGKFGVISSDPSLTEMMQIIWNALVPDGDPFREDALREFMEIVPDRQKFEEKVLPHIPASIESQIRQLTKPTDPNQRSYSRNSPQIKGVVDQKQRFEFLSEHYSETLGDVLYS